MQKLTTEVPVISVLVALCLLCILHCSSVDRINYPCAVVIVGEVDLIRKGTRMMLENDQYLQSGDTVRVNKNAKVKFAMQDGTFWYLNKESEIIVGQPVPVSDKKQRLPLIVSRGQLHIVKRNGLEQEYSIATPQWELRVTAADITVSIGEDPQSCSVSLINGFTTFTHRDGIETILPVCNRLVRINSGPDELQPINIEEITALKSWVGSSIVDEALALSGCSLEDTVISVFDSSNTTPPEWIRFPNETARLNDTIYDTIEAVDPEQGTVSYELIKGPSGMRLDAQTGVLFFPAVNPGKNSVSIRALDPQGNACTTNTVINVTRGILVRLIAPRIVEPGTPFDIAAVVGAKFNAIKLSYRFDLDGDGKYEFPGNGRYTKEAEVKNYQINEENVYRVKVEARTDDGQRFWAGKTIVVNAPPVATLQVIPKHVPLGSPVVFDISGSRDVRNGAVPLKVRYDIDGDGTWDIPQNGIASVSRTLTYYYKEAGTYTVLAQLTDKDSAVSIASASVVVGGNDSVPTDTAVIDTPQIKESPIVTITVQIDAGGPYHTGVNKECTLRGIVKGQTDHITTFSWDVNGDGVVDHTSATASDVKYQYKNAGVFNALFSVELDNGKRVVDSTRVEVVNIAPKAAAGDDILSKRKRKIKLSGTGTDEDGTIKTYEWDFDGNGTFDWSSPQNGNVEHSFTEYTTAIFRVTDSDGANGYDTIRIIICPDGMETIEEGKFCIDRYEYPNKPNSIPKTEVTFEEARNICKKFGKRLCTSDEWEMACTNSRKHNQYPYGKKFEAERCNTLGNPRLKNSLASSGEFGDCRTDNDIYDMSGNVAEWTLDRSGNYFVYGGSWQNGELGSRCSSRVKLQKNKRYFYAGFRCCK